jgi:hypothetical protein
MLAVAAVGCVKMTEKQELTTKGTKDIRRCTGKIKRRNRIQGPNKTKQPRTESATALSNLH